jgi:hypothetical protein
MMTPTVRIVDEKIVGSGINKARLAAGAQVAGGKFRKCI